MYIPTQFREERPEVLKAAMTAIGLATLVTAIGGEYHSSLVPLVVKEGEAGLVLEGHVARANQHWRDLGQGTPSLAIYQGPQAYVSPSWYPSKQEHGKVVPTWHYVAIQARGRLVPIEDGRWLADHLDDLTLMMEGGRDHPWAVGDAPADFVRNLTRAIVGLRLEVETLDGVWKMGQHRPAGDRMGTITGLGRSAAAGDVTVSEVMRDLEAARSV